MKATPSYKLETNSNAHSTENKKNFRYTHCTAVPSFTHSYYYRNTDAKPYGARMSLSDSDRNFLFDEGTGCVVTNEKGWRMGRANVVAREGTFYYEVKILKGVCPSTGNPTTNGTAADALPRKSSHAGPVPHVRIGWARREAPLDAPVGFDGYSYGLTDTRLEPMHKSRASKFLDKGADAAQAPAPPKKSGKSKSAGAGTKAKQPPSTAFSADDSAREGDVIGLSITLPSLTLHRKIAAGTYNPLVDVGTGEDTTGNDDLDAAPNIVRDRFPVPYKGGMYFESIQYAASKGMEGYGDRGPFSKETPSPNHADATLRSLPGSLVRVWKNGRRVGTAFKEVMAFLPPCSHPANEKGVRPGLDDGMVGYYPAVGVFSGAVAQVNFGPEWWCSPEGFEGPTGAQGGAQVDEPKKENGEGGGMKDGEVGALRDSVKQEDGEGEVKKEGEDTVMTDANNVDISPNPPSAPKPANSCVRGIGERYKEQIAEDVVYDLIDEADWFVQDGGTVPVE